MLLLLKNVTKTFYGVKVLDDIRFELKAGEVHALIGENGAGKSTLAHLIAGVHQPDSGTFMLEDREVSIGSPYHAKKLGIAIVHQEPPLLPDMTVAENIFLSRQADLMGIFTNNRRRRRQAKQLLRSLGSSLHPDTLVRYLSASDRYLVAIAQAISRKPKILIMDEPSDYLPHQDRGRLFDLVRDCSSQGIGIVYITHRLKEIANLCDRITILRDGKHVITRSVEGLSEKQTAALMLGREIGNLFPPLREQFGKELLRVEKLTRWPELQDISFVLRQGEIVGVAGMAGAGRTELADTLFGQMRKDHGAIYRDEKRVEVGDPYDAVKQNFGYVRENRIDSGLLMNMSVTENLSISSLDKINRYKFLHRGEERELALDKIVGLDIKLNHLNQQVKYLSGGNQQKVMLGRWLAADSEVYLLDEPTQGIDVGAKAELYVQIHNLAHQGKGILLISSDIQELVGLCNRILVMRGGKIIENCKSSETSEEQIAALIS